MLASLLPRILNHLLAQAEWARRRLRPEAGKIACFELGTLRLLLVVTDDGYLASATSEAPADVTLQLPTDLGGRLLQGQEALLAGMRIAGDAEFADALGFVLRHLDWNAEEDLSRVIGDIPAHRAVTTVRQLASSLPRILGDTAASIATYLTEERPTLLGRPALERHAAELAELRDRLARTEKRLERLGR